VLAERGVIEVGCEFCGRQWRFDPVDAARALAAADPAAGGRSVH
jgi:molecular chaperone Hsp33